MSKVKVSVMTGKLKKVSAVNSSPLDNPFCLEMAKSSDNICHYCYSQSMLKGFRKNCRPSWAKTGEKMSSQPLDDSEVPTIKTELCRFSAHGELFNKTHADNCFTIARGNPSVQFALWTKRPELVDVDNCPDNVVLVLSSKCMNVPDELPDGFHKVFTVWSGLGIEREGVIINCGARDCDACRLCYNKNNGVVNVNEKIKGGK